MNDTKPCTSCKVEKQLCEYNRDKTRKDGLQNRCKECKRQQDKEYGSKNKDRINQRSKEWRKANPERSKEKIKQWHKEHRERCRELQRASWQRASKERKLAKRVSGSIKLGLHGHTRSKAIFERLGYTVEQLKEHIASKFKEGMSWENYGEWHIDHITPQSWLPFTSIEDENFIKCWALDNLQPLWANENCSKQDRFAG